MIGRDGPLELPLGQRRVTGPPKHRLHPQFALSHAHGLDPAAHPNDAGTKPPSRHYSPGLRFEPGRFHVAIPGFHPCEGNRVLAERLRQPLGGLAAWKCKVCMPGLRQRLEGWARGRQLAA